MSPHTPGPPRAPQPTDIKLRTQSRLLEVSFDAARLEGQTIRIDAAYVDDRLAALSHDEDLSRFIL